MRRLNKGQSGWLLYDHEHRNFVCCARRPNDELKYDIIGYYSYGATRTDLIEDIAQYTQDNPAVRRKEERNGKRFYRERVTS